MNKVKNRPFNVTLIAILMIISASLLIIASSAAFYLVSLLDQGLIINNATLSNVSQTFDNGTHVNATSQDIDNIRAILIDLATVIGLIMLAIAITSFFLSWALINKKHWAWLYSLIISIISISASLTSLMTIGTGISIISLIINVAVVYYLFRQDVKTFFNKLTSL